jgi:Tfp pilus assembly protein PilE
VEKIQKSFMERMNTIEQKQKMAKEVVCSGGGGGGGDVSSSALASFQERMEKQFQMNATKLDSVYNAVQTLDDQLEETNKTLQDNIKLSTKRINYAIDELD